MAEEKNNPTEKTSFIEGLKEKIKKGKTPHEVIGEVLREDAQKLYTFHEGYLQAKAGVNPSNALDNDLTERYELRPLDSPELYDLSLPKHLSFVAGFSYVASYFYPTLEKASRPPTNMKPSLPPTAARLLEHLEADRKNSILNELHLGSQVDEAMIDEVRDRLKSDPSGEVWLVEEAKQEFREENLELAGALKAIRGAKKLFDELGT